MSRGVEQFFESKICFPLLHLSQRMCQTSFDHIVTGHSLFKNISESNRLVEGHVLTYFLIYST